MLLTLFILVLIGFLTAFLSSQGTLSAILELAIAFFASLLALALYEILAPLLDSWRPDYSRGVCFLGLFFVSFSIVRFASDRLISKNVVLPAWLDRTLAGVLGLCASLLIVGTTITGIEMLPLPERLLALSEPTTAEFVSQHPFPANLVTGIYTLVSGRGLLGTRLDSVHPDLGLELTGYRHTVTSGARQALSPDLIQVNDVFDADEALKAACRLTSDPGKKILVVRTTIEKGSTQPKVACDVTTSGDLLLLTPPQVRLVAAIGTEVLMAPSAKAAPSEADRRAMIANAIGYRQYYPIGVIRGAKYDPLDLAVGCVSDEFAGERMSHDWVFAVDEKALPTLLEIKQGGRVSLDGKFRGAPPKPIDKANIGIRSIDQHASGVNVLVRYNNAPSANARVLVVRVASPKRQTGNLLDTAFDNLTTKAKFCRETTGGWTPSGTPPNVPGEAELDRYANSIRDLSNAAPDQPILWSVVLPALLNSSLLPKPEGNVAASAHCFNDEIVPRMGRPLVEGKTDAAGRIPEASLPAGDYLLLVTYQTDKLFAVVSYDLKLNAKETKPVTIDLTPLNAKTVFHIQLP